jgi:hypothetical protein
MERNEERKTELVGQERSGTGNGVEAGVSHDIYPSVMT